MKKKPIRILGLDPGSTILGWGTVLVKGNQITYETSGYIVGQGGDRYGRIYSLTQQLGRVIKKLGRIHSAGVESGFVGGKKGRVNFQSNLALSEARGAIVNCAFASVGFVRLYAPSSVKKTVTQDGHADKQKVAGWLEMITGKLFAQEDESDAVAVAFCHALKRKR